MAMKKGFCIKCRSAEPRRRIFMVNSESLKCYCPRCMAEYKPKNAINHYNHYIRYVCKRADTSLYTAKRPDLAYDQFGQILEFENEFPRALIGRLTSLFYLSTLRRSRFKDVMTLMSLDADRYHLVGSHDYYLNFLKTVNGDCETYRARAFKLLTFKNYFYDMECLKLYVRRLQEIIDFKKCIQKELKLIGEEDAANAIDVEILDFQERLNKTTYYTVDGHTHLFKGFEMKDAVLFLDSKESIDSSIIKYRPASLNPVDKNTNKIKDQIFRNNRTSYAIAVGELVGGIISANIGIGFLITSIFTKKPLSLAMLILGIFFTILGGFFIFWQYLFKKMLSKRSF